MNLSIPFYGYKGTICKITENDKYYITYRYGTTEKEEKTIFLTPKNNKKSCNELIKNYCDDLNNYLNKYKNKYDTYKVSRTNKLLSNNFVNILSSCSIIMLSLSVPLLLTHEALGYLGVALDVLSVPPAAIAIKLFKEKKDEDKKTAFIKKYDNLKNELNIQLKQYPLEKRRSKTEYKGLENSVDEPIRDISKCLTKKVA